MNAKLISEAIRLAGKVPMSFLTLAAETLETLDREDVPAIRARLAQRISHPDYRARLLHFIDTWQTQAQNMPAQAVAISLRTAAQCEEAHRQELSIEPVWTGPENGVLPLRRTEQALLQLIDAAKGRLLIVSYAVYNIPQIGAALLRAADRNVSIKIVIETPDEIEGKQAYSTLTALGESVAARCRVYRWPAEKRAVSPTGKPGILHVKCAIADGRQLFLSSANLTEYAFTTNMELGLLITGGSLPEQIETHFRHLVQAGMLVNI